jgi:D-cysteine desulfhydrase family pyridoxal phosphate-dependent enzyme
MRLDEIPRTALTQLPTPLDDAPRLAQRLGLRKLLIKRDDCTTLAMGGNKVRKLEYLMADALAKGADVVMTDGGPQSNHARLTAAACRKVGIERCVLFLGGPAFERFDGNLLLDVALGAEIRFMLDATVQQMEDAMQAEAENLRTQGRTPYVIPIGGSTPMGAMGYVNGIRELAGQLGDEDKAPLIFLAVGSAGTLTGCALGVKLFLAEAELIGVSVSSRIGGCREKIARVAPGAIEMLGLDSSFELPEIRIEDSYIGECYGVPTEAGNAAILEVAQSEAIILDPVYTGKAMSGLIDMARRKLIDTDRTVIFIHTGGGAGLFAFESEFRGLAKIDWGSRA